MIFYQRYSDAGLVYFKWNELSSLDDLLKIMVDLKKTDDLSGPFLHDMRSCSLSNIEARDMNRYIVGFKNKVQEKLDNPCVFLVQDIARFGRLRLWGVLSDLSGLRPEEKALVTTEVPEALLWVSELPGFEDSVELAQFVQRAENDAINLTI